jgi:hypothetical protein
MDIKSNLRIILGGIAVAAIVGTIILLILNVNAPVAVSQQTYNGVPVIVKTCTPIPDTPLNPFASTCLASTIQDTNPAGTGCPNNGIPIDGVCPDSATSLPSNTTVPSNPTSVSGGTQETIKLIPSVSLVDNLGNIIPLQTNTFNLNSFLGSQKLSFISQGQANNPIDHGKILFAIIIQTSTPNEQIVANGTIWVSINSNQLHPQGLKWAINGLTDSSNRITANIQTPIGIIQKYTLDVASNAQIINLPANQLNFSISNVNVQNAFGSSYKKVPTQTIFTTTLNYDPYRIIHSANGTNVIVLPSDDTFTLSANPTTVITHPPPIVCPAGYSAYACEKSQYLQPKTVSITYPSVKAGSVSIFLESSSGEKLLGSSIDIGTSGSKTISQIPRDSDIKIVIAGGQFPLTQLYHTPFSQISLSYACTYTGCKFG